MNTAINKVKSAMHRCLKNRYLLLPLAALAQQTCGDDNSLSIDDANRRIEFRTTIGQRITRVTETTTSAINDFKVSAFWRPADPAAFTPNFMYGIDVARNGSAWEYSPEKYYPINGIVNFYAYSPAGSLSATNFTANANAPEVTYLVSPAADLQEDFLVANALPIDNAGAWENPWKATGSVHLAFHHALALVEFHARSEANGVTFFIRDISLLNLKPKGVISLEDLTWKSVSGNDTHYPAALADTGATIAYNAALIAGGTFIPVTQMSDMTAMVVLPQNITAGVAGTQTPQAGNSYIAVSYAAIDAEGFPLYGDVVPAIAYLPLTLPGSKFEAGKRYIFQLKLGTGLTPISFDLDLSGWDNTTGNIGM
jgi:hypothetical protein